MESVAEKDEMTENPKRRRGRPRLYATNAERVAAQRAAKRARGLVPVIVDVPVDRVADLRHVAAAMRSR